MHFSNLLLLSAPLLAAGQLYSPSDIYTRDAAQADVAAAQQKYAQSVQKMQGKMQQQQNQLAAVVQSQRRGLDYDSLTSLLARDAAQADVAAAQQKYAKSVQNMQGKMQQQNNQLAKVVQSQGPSRRRDLDYDTLSSISARDAAQADVIAAQQKFNQGVQKMQQSMQQGMQQQQNKLAAVVQSQAPVRRDLEADALLADIYARDAFAEADPEAFDDAEDTFDFY